MRWLFLLFLQTVLFADLADHFKPVTNKSPAYSMRGIDFIYLINLDERPEKLRALAGSIVAQGIPAFEIVVCGNPAPDGRWRSTMELTPGSHTLRVWANHPSGQYTAGATNTFTLSSSGADSAVAQYDGNGNVNRRIWKFPNGQTNRTQTLTWDAFDRLVKAGKVRYVGASNYRPTRLVEAITGFEQQIAALCREIIESRSQANTFGPDAEPVRGDAL